ncbi:hypothetical protein K2173_027040 [Erythroxylum novogranatense]|uniref:Zinc finger protein n=1 Tax=Erythroxylum novogranatense TaxID=1862640 RepID=A0AAV8U0H1_9ROSI|nr:hypothetical protein K2173_027040 [Erythroxylum novogranatense]
MDDDGGGGDFSANDAAPFSNVPLQDAPVLLLVLFHHALRVELEDFLQLAVTTSESGSSSRELVVELRRRFDFIKLAHKYHCAAEDEVIFSELNAYTENVVCTFMLEHRSIDDAIEAVSRCLDVLMDGKENGVKPFQDLVLCISTMQCSIFHHMLKEEEQVFRLLMQHFSPKEQASLVWQFFSSVPIILIKDLLPWMMRTLSHEKQVEVKHCIREIVPEDKSLQEVVLSWLYRDDQSNFECFTKIKDQEPNGSLQLQKEVKLVHFMWPHKEIWNWKKIPSTERNVQSNLVRYLHLWHCTILKDLKEIMEVMYQSRYLTSSVNMNSIIARVKFHADVVIFYRNALRTFFYPVVIEFAKDHVKPSFKVQSIEKRIESLHLLFHHDDQDGTPVPSFVETFCQELQYFAIEITEQFHFQETEVFPLISKYCSHEMQQQIVYMSLNMMPIGLLKCATTWFAANLSENESRSILQIISQADFSVNSFLSLLREWYRMGYSGKISAQDFSNYFQNMFQSRFSFLSEHINLANGCSPLNRQPCKKPTITRAKLFSANNGKKLLSASSSSGSHKTKTYDTSYTSEINLHLFFPNAINSSLPTSKLFGEEISETSSSNEPLAIDIIFFFHKALKKDLNDLVLSSTQLAENSGLLMEFQKHFNLLRSRYQFHSDMEDEIVFPVLEAKEEVRNLSLSYTLDHKLEVKLLTKISFILNDLSELQIPVLGANSNMQDQRIMMHSQLCVKLHRKFIAIHKLLFDHINREEIEIWTVCRQYFSMQEQEKIIGHMLGRARAETLQDMIPWLVGILTPGERQAMMSILCKITKNTMFDEWLREWWEGNDIPCIMEELSPSCRADPLEIVSKYLSKDLDKEDVDCEEGIIATQQDCFGTNLEMLTKNNSDEKKDVCHEDQINSEFLEHRKLPLEGSDKNCNRMPDVRDKINKPGQPSLLPTSKFRQHEHLLTLSQENLEAAIRRVSRDHALDCQKKSRLMQNLLMSRWIVRQRISQEELYVSSNAGEIPGQCPSYRDPLKLTLGCKHYKRHCKLVMECCTQLYTCIRCHDEIADHSVDRRVVRRMMCMRCLVIQPIGQTCLTASCNKLSMARYYCRICKLFDDAREIYHCPFCNLCRVGKGLGIDYLHCMNCNACMSKSLSVHVCREKSVEDNCPICHEDIFTSNNPIKALPCGHFMHSTCFQDYTYTNYTCPICNKSLGDMQVYFKMLDALLAEEKIPYEYSKKTQELQAILCNDCEKKGAAPFHWFYHKCPFCGSYNTRVI